MIVNFEVVKLLRWEILYRASWGVPTRHDVLAWQLGKFGAFGTESFRVMPSHEVLYGAQFSMVKKLPRLLR